MISDSVFLLERGDLVKNDKKSIFITLFLILGFILIISSMPILTFADDLPSTHAAEVAELKSISKIGQTISGFFNIACIIAVAFSIFQLIISRDQKTINGAYKYITTIFSVFLIFNLLGSILIFANNNIQPVYYDYKHNSVIKKFSRAEEAYKEGVTQTTQAQTKKYKQNNNDKLNNSTKNKN